MSAAFDLDRGDTPETALERLAETIRWCAPRANVNDPKNCLRSSELMPHALENGRKRVVASVAVKRFLSLGRPSEMKAANLAGGRLLIYEPDVNLAHGLEELETNGFVDHDNTPPWDTWVAYIYEPNCNYLLCWVPPEFVQIVSNGISVSPEESFRWLDDADLLLTREFRGRLQP